MKTMLAAVIGALVLALHAPAAHAQQQQWAAAYIDWSIPNNAAGASRIEQDIAVLAPSRASFFTLNWDFLAGDGGYIGLQTDPEGIGNVRFSLWNAVAARDGVCRRFDGEGEGMTCEAPLAIASDRYYRVRVERGARDAGGQWWSGWIDAPDAAGATQSILIGALQVAPSLSEIAPATVYNFNEYWGDAVRACRDVPLSAAAFAAPAVASASGAPRIGASPIGRRPDGHPCASGGERTGAAASHALAMRRAGPVMIMVLGGSTQENRAFGQSAVQFLPAIAP